MSGRTILYIIIFSSLSLVGLIVSQGIWVVRALDLAERQHSHRVDLALDDVLEELVDLKDSVIINETIGLSEKNEPENLFEVMDTLVLQFLIEKYVSYHDLGDEYAFKVKRTSDDSLFYSSGRSLKNPEKARIHKACLYCLWKKDYFHLEISFPKVKKYELIRMSSWLISSGIFILIVALSFYYTISTVIKQKKISQIRDDFINNITHEFKTPIATISLASEVLLNEKKEEPDSRIAKYARVIYDENKRMRAQVEKVLQMAVMDKQDYNLELKEYNLDNLIRTNVQNLCLEECKDEVEIIDELNASKPNVRVDAIHFTSIIQNLVTNSLKYQRVIPKLTLQSRSENGRYIFSIEDNGIGIKKEDLPYIFDKFYRVSTGNLHNVKGFGIGLYYVKTMVSAHKGTIQVWSEFGKGTKFEISLPQSIDEISV